MNGNFQDNGAIEGELTGNKLITRGIIIILLSPILGFLFFIVYYLVISSFVPGTVLEEPLIILSGISIVGFGISLVIIGCTKNIIKSLLKHN